MRNLKLFINILLLLAALFYLHPISSSFAGMCDEQTDNDAMSITPSTPTITGVYNYTDSWFSNFQFYPGNPDEIDQNDAIIISIIGGCSPYTWSVSGNGFSLAESQTTGLTNTLIADDTACGTATITVTGCVGPPAVGYVRCSTGGWTLIESCTDSIGSSGGACHNYLTTGKYRHYNVFVGSAHVQDCQGGCKNSSCLPDCLSYDIWEWAYP